MKDLEEKIAEIVEEGMWNVESQEKHLDYTVEHLLTLFTSYANEVANKAVLEELKYLKGIDCFNEPYTSDPRPARMVDIRLKLRTKTGEEEKWQQQV